MKQNSVSPFEYYKAAIEKRTPSQRSKIARIKRFLECMSGDPKFRSNLEQHPHDAQKICQKAGLDIDPYALKPMWENGFKVNLTKELIGQYELISLWTDWLRDLIEFRDRMRTHGQTPLNPAFHNWRNRQMARCDNELGDTKSVIIHSPVAFELSGGCSVGCWFCGLNAASFEGYYPATLENIALWKEVLSTFRTCLGDGVQTGFCYWGTEPTDNPDYLTLIQVYRDTIGVLPQTTTARPAKDLEWTRTMIQLYDQEQCVPARFSVLSRSVLDKIHGTFTPEELLCVDLIQQHSGAVTVKAGAGRFLDQDNPDFVKEETETTGTIACVSGFLVNMQRQTIELVSPCRASKRWPTGYRIHKRGRFTDGTGIKRFIQEACDELMPPHLTEKRIIRFRGDLTFEYLDKGFSLKNDCTTIRFCGDFHRKMGKLLVKGSCSTGDIITALCQDTDFFSVTSALQLLYDKGLLDDFTNENDLSAETHGN